jgi:hypothetical protein
MDVPGLECITAVSDALLTVMRDGEFAHVDSRSHWQMPGPWCGLLLILYHLPIRNGLGRWQSRCQAEILSFRPPDIHLLGARGHEWAGAQMGRPGRLIPVTPAGGARYPLRTNCIGGPSGPYGEGKICARRNSSGGLLPCLDTAHSLSLLPVASRLGSREFVV